ncbi:MAG: PLDc N-terminal domain-containing protein [Chitinophagaceae bacterium]
MQIFLGSNLILLIVFTLLTFVLLVYALRRFFRNQYYKAGTELGWVALIIFLPMLGPLLYLLHLSLNKKKEISMRTINIRK